MTRRDGEYTTVTVRSSWTAATATGATGLVLDTAELGPIAFALNLEAIQTLRRQLDDAEAFLAQNPGHA